jgi:cystathionine gamma-synthase
MDERTLPSLSQRTVAASALGAGEPTTRALTPPIHLATTYVRGEDSNYNTGFVYERSDNFFIHQVEALIAELEHTSQAIMFGSGMARRSPSCWSVSASNAVDLIQCYQSGTVRRT